MRLKIITRVCDDTECTKIIIFLVAAAITAAEEAPTEL
jgi:hypothetical protein